MSELLKKPLVMPGSPQLKSSGPGGSNSRRADRYPVTAQAEVIDSTSQIRVMGRTSDIGLGGCYIDTISPLAVGSVARVRVEHAGRIFETLATVVYAHISMGMGLAFTEMKSDHLGILTQWIGVLSGQKDPEPAPFAATATATENTDTDPAVANLRHALNELINLMVRKKIVAENEAAALLHRIFMNP